MTSESDSRRIRLVTAEPSHVLFVFLDGVGIGVGDPDINPFFTARLPTFAELAGGRLPSLDESRTGRAFALDARLDTDGTPQSGTGQTALLTGEDSARIHGGHFGPWTPVRLRPLVEERSLLRRAVDAGRKVAFANAYPRGWPGPGGSRRVAGPPLAARGAGLLDRHEEALGSGDAVSSEIVNDGWRRHLGHGWLPDVSPEDAGRNLADIAGTHDLTLYAHYSTDTAGHRSEMAPAVRALERVDAFFAGLLERLEPDTLLFVASDHGNIEDVRTGHTTNPSLGLARGPGEEEAGELTDIREVAGFLLGKIGVRS